jgi:hypothetical protein
MRIGKNASGKTTVKLSQQEWIDFGKKAGWLNKSANQGVLTENQKIIQSIKGALPNSGINLQKAIPFLENVFIEFGENNLPMSALLNVMKEVAAGGESPAETPTTGTQPPTGAPVAGSPAAPAAGSPQV